LHKRRKFIIIFKKLLKLNLKKELIMKKILPILTIVGASALILGCSNEMNYAILLT